MTGGAGRGFFFLRLFRFLALETGWTTSSASAAAPSTSIGVSVGGGASAGDVGWSLTSRGLGASDDVEDLTLESAEVFVDGPLDPFFDADEDDDVGGASSSGRGLMLASVSRPSEHWHCIDWMTTWEVA